MTFETIFLYPNSLLCIG